MWSVDLELRQNYPVSLRNSLKASKDAESYLNGILGTCPLGSEGAAQHVLGDFLWTSGWWNQGRDGSKKPGG